MDLTTATSTATATATANSTSDSSRTIADYVCSEERGQTHSLLCSLIEASPAIRGILSDGLDADDDVDLCDLAELEDSTGGFDAIDFQAAGSMYASPTTGIREFTFFAPDDTAVINFAYGTFETIHQTVKTLERFEVDGFVGDGYGYDAQRLVEEYQFVHTDGSVYFDVFRWLDDFLLGPLGRPIRDELLLNHIANGVFSFDDLDCGVPYLTLGNQFNVVSCDDDIDIDIIPDGGNRTIYDDYPPDEEEHRTVTKSLMGLGNVVSVLANEDNPGDAAASVASARKPRMVVPDTAVDNGIVHSLAEVILPLYDPHVILNVTREFFASKNVVDVDEDDPLGGNSTGF